MRICLMLLLSLWLSAPAQASTWYVRTPREKLKQVILFLPRYIKFITVDDFGLRDSIRIAWDADFIIGLHNK